MASRASVLICGLAVALAANMGLAAPASAAYANQPTPLAWTPPGPVHAMVASDGRLYVGYYVASTGVGGVAALDASTGSLVWSVATSGAVRALTMSADGARVIAGGGFNSVEGMTRRHLVAMSAGDGSVVATWRPAASSMVRDLVVDGDILYVAGTFNRLNGVAQTGLGAVYVTSGKRVDSFTGFVDNKVYGLAKTGSRLIVAGRFTLANNQPRSSLASFDLATGELTSWAPKRVCTKCGTYWDVTTDNANAYVGVAGPGGQFAAFNLSTGGQPWPAVHADGDVQAVMLGDDGLAYIGGHFGQWVGSDANPRTELAAIDPSTGAVDPYFAPRLYTFYPGVWALARTSGMLYAGGHFSGVRSDGVNNHVPYLTAFSR